MGGQTQPRSLSQSQPYHSQSPLDCASASQSVSVIEPSADLSRNPTNPAKIPIRPQKMRKLSTNTSIDSSEPKNLVTANAEDSEVGAVSTSSTTVTKARRRNPLQLARALPLVLKPLSADGEIELALQHLRAVDHLIAALIDTNPPPTFELHHPPFLALTKSILYQQLAYKAGTSIYTRFVALCGGENTIRPDAVLALSTQQLKQIGVSSRKAIYLYDLANKYKTGILSDDSIVRMDDRSLFTMLSMVKGIGCWSVHMFMIFSLHRPDVLPVSDLGVRKGVQLLYGLDDLPRPSQMEQLCEQWRPYRSVGAWYMWRFVEGKGTPTAGAAIALESNVNYIQPMQQIDQRQQDQMQLLEPITSIGSLGACIWRQRLER